MRLRFLILFLLVIVLFFGDLALGSLDIDVLGVIFGGDSDATSRTLLLNYRLPKAIVAVLSGVALSLSGLTMQTIFRNPLAGPYILGVSSGASLGVAIFLLGMPLLGVTIAADIGIALSAFVGAAAVMLVVLALSVRLRDVMTVLILGMMISSATVAFVDVLQYFSADSALKGFVLWAMGSLGGVSYAQILIITIAVLLGLSLIIKNIRGLDALLLGENYAHTLGINMRRVRLELFIATSLLAGGITAYCGPIAFIGIATPHIARMLYRTSAHRPLILSSALLGAAVMLLCDIVASMPYSDTTLPINTITSLFGIPVVVMIVVRSKRGKIM
ncbi:MAG: iron ABC transporter permease [Rikenellaceae bacterium]